MTKGLPMMVGVLGQLSACAHQNIDEQYHRMQEWEARLLRAETIEGKQQTVREICGLADSIGEKDAKARCEAAKHTGTVAQ